MSATLVDRQPVREYVKTALSSYMTGAQVFYDYEPGPDELQHQSPAVCVSSAGTEQAMQSYGYNPARMLLTVGIWIRIGTGGIERATAEDLLDELDRQLRQWVRDNAGPTYSAGAKLWDNVQFAGASKTGYWPIQNIWYRREERVLAFNVGALSDS